MPKPKPKPKRKPKPKDFLKKVLEETAVIAGALERRPFESTQEAAAKAPPVRNFHDALYSESGIRVICEIKKASPTAGVIRQDFDPARIAGDYEAGGASALSVLTNATYFQGSMDHLRAARAAVDLPVLRKDFVIGPAQIWESRAAGADAVLFIVRMLRDGELQKLMRTAAVAGLHALVEVHDEKELDRAVAAGATIIGVNARNLDTLEVDIKTCERLAGRLPKGTVCVAESGIASRADLLRMQDAGYHAALIGEHFMRQPDITTAVKEMLGLSLDRTALIITEDDPAEEDA